jgi:hypothetical protein
MWHPDDSVSSHPFLHLWKKVSPSHVKQVRILTIIYHGLSKNQGNLLSPWSIIRPAWQMGFHQGLVAVDQAHSFLSRSTTCKQKMLQVTTVNIIIGLLPQWHKQWHKPHREAELRTQAVPTAPCDVSSCSAAESFSLCQGLKINIILLYRSQRNFYIY